MTEITTSADGTVTVEEQDKSLVEEVYEAIFDTEADDEASEIAVAMRPNSSSSLMPIETGAAEFRSEHEMVAPDAFATDVVDTPEMGVPADVGYGVADPAYAATTSTDSSVDASLEAADSRSR